MSHKPPVSAELSRDLNLFHIIMMGMGMMIGAGVFLGIGISTQKAGPGGVILTFALNGLIALFSAMSYAELSSAIPRAGGAYNFARVAFGRGTSFLAGWMEWFASSVAGAMYAVTFSMYTLEYLGTLPFMRWLPCESPILLKGLALAVGLFFIYINYRGASETGKAGAVITLGQTLFMVALAGLGVVTVMLEPSRLSNFQPAMPNGWGVLLATMGFTYVAFEGFEVIAQAGDEAIDPKRNIPKAMLYSVLFVTIIYVFVSFATIVAVKAGAPGVEGAPWQWIGSFGEKGFYRAIGKSSVPYSGLLLTLAVIFSSTSALNATIYSATRASYALGRDRMLPAVFSRISRTRKTPHVALSFTAVIVLVVAMLPVKDVASSASIMFLFLFFLVNVCVIKIRRNMADELSYGFVMPLFPLLPILAIVMQALLAVWLVHMSFVAWIVAPVWVLAGIVLFQSYSKSRAVATEDEIRVFEEQQAPETGGYRVMVGVANPKSTLSLVLSAQRLCQAKDAHVELLHMVPVPDQVPLSDAEKYMHPGREAMVEAMLYLAPQFPISSTLRYCRNVARGIVSAVRQKRVDLLILGWHGHARSRLFHLGSTVDPVMERAPCNVVVLKDCSGKNYKRILVPLAGGPNGAFALEIASILADPNEGRIVAFTVGGHGKFDIGTFVAEQLPSMHVPEDRVESRVVNASNVSQAILREAEDYDLVVIGCTERPFLRSFAAVPVPEVIAQRCPKPVVMVKSSAGIRTWIKRWI